MPYIPSTCYFRCVLNENSQRDRNILSILVNLLGEPEESGRLHPFIVLDSGNTKRKGYQVRIAKEQLVLLQEQMNRLDIPFFDVFERDWRHFHPYCYIGEDYHSGTAEEREDDSWDLYYEDGTLDLGDEPGNYFICNIKNADINELKDIYVIFEKWLKEQIKNGVKLKMIKRVEFSLEKLKIFEKWLEKQVETGKVKREETEDLDKLTKLFEEWIEIEGL